MTDTITAAEIERPVAITSPTGPKRRRVLLVAGFATLAVCGTVVGTSVATSADRPSAPATVKPHDPARWGGPDVHERAGTAARTTSRWGGPDVQERAGNAGLGTQR